MISNHHFVNSLGNITHNWKHIAAAVNLVAILVLLIFVSLSEAKFLDDFHILLIKLNLYGFGLASLGIAFKFKAIIKLKHIFILAIAHLAILTGILIPVSSPFGAAFSSSFLTAGVTLALSDCIWIWSVCSNRNWLNQAWSEMTFMLTLLPVSIMSVTFIFLYLEWPPIDAVPAGFLVAFFANPFVAYWRAINRMSEFAGKKP